MIVDIDLIAGYLKQFKDANIPVLWRPLHEAAGGWFWWGAKGAEPCKALWKLMFDRLVNYHKLNNLIWVWTSATDDKATTWYPGDAYVDVIGMDIYPGENQHGSQYLSFNSIKDLFGGKKIITLSECGSVPDPALMKDYGDTWSWFMPWNGDYTESDKHNGVAWWNKIFGYSNIITRDKMPSLK
jgi:mannan endo-1,4-beta-mannosidase